MKKHSIFILSLVTSFFSCGQASQNNGKSSSSASSLEVALVILGTVQDAGSPHIACEKECCTALFEIGDITRKVVSLGVVDSDNEKSYLFEATPNITEQLRELRQVADFKTTDIPDGIFLTHAHIGHYTGLMYLGKEATNAKQVPVYAMPKMKGFLENNGPWGQLVSNKNISIRELEENVETELSSNLKVIPFTVPHRDEYSETVGYKIIGPNKKVLFIPDIDKWEKWQSSIVSEIAKVDYAFLDASFYDNKEINNRDISEIPHPFVIESMELFEKLPVSEKNKVHFIHFNHTNPLLDPKSWQTKNVIEKGFKISHINERFAL